MSNTPLQNSLPQLIWKDDLNLQINDVNFYLSIDTKELQDGKSTSDCFLLGKPRHVVEKFSKLINQNKLDKVFELGILQGGSITLFDQLWNPEKIVAIEYTPEPVALLTKYIESHNKKNQIKPYYGVNQADRLAMENVLRTEFPNKDIDFIIDDASHLYQETRKAFNICFPFLKAGGLYYIEDWAWAHWAGDYWQEGGNTFLADRTAMSNLLIELFMMSASSPGLIQSITIDYSTIIIKKGYEEIPEGKFNIGDHYLMRGKAFGAWL
jgi:predicted O-methyltransferase YrrM